MFASIRRYRLRTGDMGDLEMRVDNGFAEEIRTQPGFVAYEFIDCGSDEITTVSIFRNADQAERSRELAQQWTEESLSDLEFTRLGAIHGEIIVSRGSRTMLEPGHLGSGHGMAALRHYRVGHGSIEELMHIVDTEFAERITALDGFEAYHVLDCGDREIVAMSVMRDRDALAQADELARGFVQERLTPFEPERTRTQSGVVVVSRAMAALLVPTHA